MVTTSLKGIVAPNIMTVMFIFIVLFIIQFGILKHHCCYVEHTLASCMPTLYKCQHFIIQGEKFGVPFNHITMFLCSWCEIKQNALWNQLTARYRSHTLSRAVTVHFVSSQPNPKRL